MFGYVNVNRKELSKEDQERLQQYYCGLSRQLKIEGGLTGQMVLNWDMVSMVNDGPLRCSSMSDT